MQQLGSVYRPDERFELLGRVLIDAETAFSIRGPSTQQSVDQFVGFLGELYVGLRAPVTDPAWPRFLSRLQQSLHTGSILRHAQELGLPVTALSGADVFAEDASAFMNDCPPGAVTFFLGAGASKPTPSNVPLVAELLEYVWERAHRLEPNPLHDLEQRCKALSIRSIEDVLTALWMANVSGTHPNLPSLFEGVLFPARNGPWGDSARDPYAIAHSLDTFNTLFSILTARMLAARPNPIHEAVCRAMESRLVNAVVTTNYDACLEIALEGRRGAIGQLIKVHGSVNWFYCGDCQELNEVPIEKLLTALEDGIPYPLIGMCPDCSGKMQQFIVPPTALKWIRFPVSIDVLSDARDAFEEARTIVVVGYSFGDADDYLVRTLIRAIGRDDTKRVIIVDPSLAVAIQGTRLLYRHLKSVAPDRILLLGVGGEEAIPHLVRHLIEQKSLEQSAAHKETPVVS